MISSSIITIIAHKQRESTPTHAHTHNVAMIVKTLGLWSAHFCCAQNTVIALLHSNRATEYSHATTVHLLLLIRAAWISPHKYAQIQTHAISSKSNGCPYRLCSILAINIRFLWTMLLHLLFDGCVMVRWLLPFVCKSYSIQASCGRFLSFFLPLFAS